METEYYTGMKGKNLNLSRVQWNSLHTGIKQFASSFMLGSIISMVYSKWEFGFMHVHKEDFALYFTSETGVAEA